MTGPEVCATPIPQYAIVQVAQTTVSDIWPEITVPRCSLRQLQTGLKDTDGHLISKQDKNKTYPGLDSTNSKISSMAKELSLKRSIVVIDLETTGVNIISDRIVEIACVKLHPDGQRETKTYLLNPECPIPKDATAVHGIRDIDVGDQPVFGEVANELLEFLSDCDLSGFNIKRFDLPLLTGEFARMGISFPEKFVHVVDTMSIFHINEPRDLSAAFRFYCNDELRNAHNAEADATAAADILLAQVRRYEALPSDVPGLHRFTHPRNTNWVDADGKLVWRDDEAVFSFGKYAGCSLREIAEDYPEYLHWMTGPKMSFSQEIVRVVRAALEGDFPVRPIPVAEIDSHRLQPKATFVNDNSTVKPAALENADASGTTNNPTATEVTNLVKRPAVDSGSSELMSPLNIDLSNAFQSLSIGDRKEKCI